MTAIESVSLARASGTAVATGKTRPEQGDHRQGVAEDEREPDGEHDRRQVAPAERGADRDAQHLADRTAREAVRGRAERDAVEARSLHTPPGYQATTTRRDGLRTRLAAWAGRTGSDPRSCASASAACASPPDADRDEERALATVATAADAGISVFDTARSYGLDEGDAGHNERLLARALRRSDAAGRARIVTKGGMARDGGRWLPDGRASRLRADCEASLVALDGLPIDLYLVHAPDPRTPWRTTLRALARLADEGLVRRVGVSNVTRGQLDEALELAPVAAVEIALSPFDDRALRGGVVDRSVERGLAVIAHAPLGGPARASRLARIEALRTVAAAHEASPAEVALAWVLSLAPASSRSPARGRRRRPARPRVRHGSISTRGSSTRSDRRSARTARPPHAERPRAWRPGSSS
jgi:aryl-alcohol dehydrogenase-like predicted oxidoreductase